MQLSYVPKKHRPVALGLIRTVPFASAGLLSLVLFYIQNDIKLDWARDLMITIIFGLLCWTVFYAVSQQLPYSKKNVIDDLLQAAVSQLGHTKYRINIMELRNSENSPYHAYFQITYGHGYANPAKYKEKITYDIPGASDAFKNRKVIYIPRSSLASEIDGDLKHLWSYPILNRRGESAAVLNIDNISDEVLPDAVVGHVKSSIKELSELISYYWELPA